MKQKRAEELADLIVGYLRSNPVSYREAIIKYILPIEECNGYPSISEALNSGDGTYKP